MKVNDLLRAASSEAIEYIRSEIKSDSKSDYRKLKKLFNDRVFEANNFSDFNLDITYFDWQHEDRDRNWWWQLQALPFLNWFCSSFQLQDKAERSRNYELCRDGVLRWIEQASTNDQSPLAWHDHASAFRVRNLANWLLFCHIHGLGLDKDLKAEPLADLILRHLDWLQQEENFSRHTNHGFDQSMIALKISLMFAGDKFDAYRNLNRKRLTEEVSFAFTEQGVHKENSPGYQKMMLIRIRQIAAFSYFGEREISAMGQRYIESAENFLSAVTLPDGNLPLIGDTRGGDAGISYAKRRGIDLLNYSESGYVIIRGHVFDREFHLIFKNSHISHYHRHDDDLSVHLYFDGHTLLGDGGLGSHNEADPKRILLRSSLAHNVPYMPDHQPIRTVSGLNGWLPKTRVEATKIIGESFGYGIPIRRELDFSGLPEGCLTIRDTVLGEEMSRLATNFYSPYGFDEQDGALYTGGERDFCLRISGDDVNIASQESLFSEEFGKFRPVRSVKLQSRSRNVPSIIETKLDLIHRAPR